MNSETKTTTTRSEATLKQRIAIALDFFLTHEESNEIADIIISDTEPLHIARRIAEFCEPPTANAEANNAQAERV
jgi:hypothetical protein